MFLNKRKNGEKNSFTTILNLNVFFSILNSIEMQSKSNKMRQILIFSALCITLFSCGISKKNEKIKASEWLLGQWENRSEEGVLIENWTKPNDSTLMAGSFFINQKDTLHFENIILKEKEGELVYETTIRGQNNDKPILFPLISETENELIFENLQNDYPQKIKYQRNSKSGITISISGTQSKKGVSEQFRMTKVK